MTTKSDFNSCNENIIIFLDMDGVIADLETHAHNTNMFKDDGKLDYGSLNAAWWAGIPKFPGAKSFYNALKNLGEVRFLTAPVPDSSCFQGKAQWISKTFLPERGRFSLLDLIICRGKDKDLLARSYSILIDDRIDNVNAWRAAGGNAVHHKGDYQKTLKEARKLAKKILSSTSKPASEDESYKIFLNKNGILSDLEAYARSTNKYLSDGTLDYENLEHKWWVNMPVTQGANKFYNNLKSIAPVRFLTAPIPSVDSISGTSEWFTDTFLPHKGRFALLDLIICRSKEKNFLARQKHILIDDRIEDLQKWKQHGGIAIHHDGDFDKTIAKLKAITGSSPNSKPSSPQF
jgi:5'(3')-deoxyribonucleotidase